MNADKSRANSRAGKIQFLPIRVHSLRVDSVTGFDLYMWSQRDRAPVLYRARDLAFSEEVRGRLEEHRVEELYVPLEQQDRYYAYIEQNLSDVLSDRGIPADEKSMILYDSAQHVVQEILNDPNSPEALPRSGRLVDQVVDHMYGDREAFLQFLKVASFDYSTFTHSVNVFVYAVTLAQALGFSDKEFLKNFGIGTLLHDIGKGRVGDAVLKKKGPLTDDEWKLMRQHPVWGWDILNEHGMKNVIVLDVTRHHHEKLTGRGYPDGIGGDEIPHYVRVSTICDIFDALTTQRPYKEALTTFDALRLMQDEMSDELDMGMFRTFVDTMAGTPARASS